MWQTSKKAIQNSESGRYGYIHEADQFGRFARGELKVVDNAGNSVTMSLARVNKLEVEEIGSRTVAVQVDGWARFPDGKLVITELKSGARGSKTSAEAFDQMERHVALQKHLADRKPNEFAREVHWRFEEAPTPEKIKDASTIKHWYFDMNVRFFTNDGFEIIVP